VTGPSVRGRAGPTGHVLRSSRRGRAAGRSRASSSWHPFPLRLPAPTAVGSQGPAPAAARAPVSGRHGSRRKRSSASNRAPRPVDGPDHPSPIRRSAGFCGTLVAEPPRSSPPASPPRRPSAQRRLRRRGVREPDESVRDGEVPGAYQRGSSSPRTGHHLRPAAVSVLVRSSVSAPALVLCDEQRVRSFVEGSCPLAERSPRSLRPVRTHR
jgi:hypothetical protein